MNPQLIANEVKSSRHFVRNVLRDYDLNNSSMPKMRETQPRSRLWRDVVEYLEKANKYSTTSPPSFDRGCVSLILGRVVEIIVPQNVSHKVPTTFYFICDQLWIHSIMVKV